MFRQARVGVGAGILVLGFLLGLPAGGAFPAPAAQAKAPHPPVEFVDGRVLVGFTTGTSALSAGAEIRAIGGEQEAVIGLGTHVVRVGAGKVQSTITALRREKNVRYAEPDYVYHLAVTPNDPSFGQLWGMNNTGQTVNGTAGTPGADIHALGAWNISTGSAAVVVADVDTGIDYTHPDLAANVWSNPGGIGGCAAGTHGYNAVAGNCDPKDDNNHGSHTAGTIGAVGNNGIGVTGVNWTTSVMAVKAFDASGSSTSTSIVQSLQFVLDARNAGVNVRVINASWGGWESSQATSDLIAQLGADDVLFVAAAGNNGLPHTLLPFYPCDYAVATIICVGASDQNDNLAYFSDYGAASVDLAAPGVNVLSTIPGGYAYYNGTSMATPHVTGAAALLLSVGYQSASAVKADILDSVDVLPSLSGKIGTSGRLDLAKLLGSAGLPGAPAAPVLAATAGDTTVDLSWTAPSDGGSPITGYNVYRGTSSGGETLLASLPVQQSYHDSGLIDGTAYYYQVTAVNFVGEGLRSAEVAATPVPPPTAPDAPTLSGVAGNGSATLCWTVPPNGGSPITGYVLQRSGGSTASVPLGPVASYSDSPLTNGATYYYQVSAVNAVGQGPSSGTLTLTPPGTPPTVTGVLPSIANGGTLVTITGTGLAPGCGTSVVFGTWPGIVVGGTDTSLTATSPAAGGSGKVTVSNPSGSATSSTDFYAVPSNMTPAEVAVTGRLTSGSGSTVSLASGQAAMFLFDGTAGSLVSLSITSDTIGLSDLSILNPDGTTFGSISPMFTNGGFVDAKALPQTGTYAVILNPRSTYSGSAKITLYLVPPDVSGNLTSGVPFAISIPTPGQNARLTFAGTSGTPISLNLNSDTISQSDLTILNPDGTTFVSISSIFTSGTFLDTKPLTQTGTYTVVLNPRSYYTGSANVTLYFVPPDVSGTLTSGSAFTVIIGTPGQNARLTFAGTAGTPISLNLNSDTISQSDLAILNPDGTTFVSISSIFTSGTFLDTKTLTQTGTYTVVLNPRGSYTGSANVTLYFIPPDVSGTLSSGSAFSVTIGTPGQNARLTFAGTSGTPISLNLNSDTISQSDLTILNPDGTTFVSISSIFTFGTFLDTKTLTQTGTYTVVLNPRGYYTGSAKLTLYFVPPDVSDTLSPGAGLTVTIGTPGQNARLSFAGTAGTSICFNLTSDTISQSDLAILNPDGTTLASISGIFTFGTFLDTKTLTQTGTYTVVLNPRSYYTGSAKLTLYLVPPDLSATLTPSVPLTVTISSPGQNARLTFSGTAGGTLTFTVTSDTFSQSDLTILNPDGTVFASVNGFFTNGCTIGNKALGQSGTYTVIFSPRNLYTGSAILTLKIQ